MKRLQSELKRQKSGGGNFLQQPGKLSAEATQKQGLAIRKSLKSNLSGQMIYKKSLNGGKKAQVQLLPLDCRFKLLQSW